MILRHQGQIIYKKYKKYVGTMTASANSTGLHESIFLQMHYLLPFITEQCLYLYSSIFLGEHVDNPTDYNTADT